MVTGKRKGMEITYGTGFARFYIADRLEFVDKEQAIEIVDHLNKVFGLIDVEVQAGFDEVMPEPDLSFLDVGLTD